MRERGGGEVTGGGRGGGLAAANAKNEKRTPLFSAPFHRAPPLRRTPPPSPTHIAAPSPRHTPRGDPSADFALATLFPAPLVPAVERASDVVSRLTGLAGAAPTVLSADALGGPALSEEAARRR